MKDAFAAALKHNRVLLALSALALAGATWAWLQGGDRTGLFFGVVLLMNSIATVLREVDRVRGTDDVLTRPVKRAPRWMLAVLAVMALGVLAEIGALILTLSFRSFSPLPVIRVCVIVLMVPLLAYIGAWCALRLPRLA